VEVNYTTLELKLPSNKRFGFSFAVVFFASSFLVLFFDQQKLAILLFSLSFAFLTATILFPTTLNWLNSAWFDLSVFLAKVNNYIVLSIMFFFFLVPMAIIGKLFGRDELQIQSINEKKSLWRKSSSQEVTLTSMTRQY